MDPASCPYFRSALTESRRLLTSTVSADQLMVKMTVALLVEWEAGFDAGCTAPKCFRPKTKRGKA